MAATGLVVATPGLAAVSGRVVNMAVRQIRESR